LSSTFPRIAVFENSASRYQNLSTGAYNVRYRVVIHTAVYFNEEMQTARLPDLGKRLDFPKARVDKRLPAKSRIHAHDKDVVDQRKNLVECVDGRRRIYDNSWSTSMRLDEVESTVEMDARFLMDRDPIGASLGERGNIFVGSFNHEMTIERYANDFAERDDDRRPDREIRDEVAIHDVDVQNGCPALNSCLSFYAEASKIRRKNRGGQLDHRIRYLVG
jgi:hypothetical protein